MRAKLAVPAGGALQVSCGEIPAPLQVNLAGILLLWKLELVSSIAV
jgi:hypothetical protein